MIKKTQNYLLGTVRCTVQGTQPERFLNLCVEEKIPFWAIAYRSPNCLALTMRAGDYRRIRPIAHRAGVTLRHTGKRGALYLSRRLQRRVALFVGAAVLAFCLWGMNTHILTIEVTGYTRVPPREILDAMAAEGVGVGTRTAELDVEVLRNHILVAVPELSWFTVTVRGSHAVVDVHERGDTPEVANAKEPADIIADRDGVIEQMRVYHGERRVEEGQLVHRGEVLVSGEKHLRIDEKTMEVHARADILARVWHEVRAVTPAAGEAKCPTGRKTTRYALCFGKFRVNFYADSGKPFDKCDKISNRYECTLTDGSRLPIALVRETYVEYESYAAPWDADTAGETLLTTAQAILAAEAPNVRPLSQRVWTSDGAAYVYAAGESIQKIGVTVPRR